MAKELSVLQQQAEAIKTEVNKGANTSSRIGGMFGDMLEYNEEKLTELEIKSVGTTISLIGKKDKIFYYSIKANDKLIFTFIESSIPTAIASLYLYKDDGNYIRIGEVGSVKKTLTYTAEEDFAYIKIYSEEIISGNSLNVRIEINSLNSSIDNIYSQIDHITDNYQELQKEIYDIRKLITLDNTSFQTNDITFRKGILLAYKAENVITDSSIVISTYLYREDGTFERLPVITEADKIYFFKLNEDFRYFKMYSNNRIQMDFVLSLNTIISKVEKNTTDINELKNTIGINPIDVLILGTSYSQNANWVRGFQKLLNIGTLVNLGTSSGALKDKKNNLDLYPYSDRPYQNIVDKNNERGNLNCFLSQVEWLKRLVSNQCRGVLAKYTLSNIISDGNVTITFGGIPYVISFTQSETIDIIAERIEATEIPGLKMLHPSSTDYIVMEALDNSVTSIQIDSEGITGTYAVLRGEETPVFQNGSYPHIIIIEGGKNDSPDSEEYIQGYEGQILTKKTEVYTTQYGGTPTLGTAYIKTPKEEVNRLSFLGALRVIVEELHELFPKSLFLVVGGANLNYGSSDINSDKIKDEQLHLAARFLSIPYVSWFSDGYCNRLFNPIKGNGSQENPYNTSSATEDTTDSMHPNDNGGLKLAIPVAEKISSMIKYFFVV